MECTQNAYTSFKFDHLMEFTRDKCWFGVGEGKDGRTRSFIFFDDGQRVYQRSSRNTHWLRVNDRYAYIILCKAVATRKRIKSDKKFIYCAVKK